MSNSKPQDCQFVRFTSKRAARWYHVTQFVYIRRHLCSPTSFYLAVTFPSNTGNHHDIMSLKLGLYWIKTKTRSLTSALNASDFTFPLCNMFVVIFVFIIATAGSLNKCRTCVVFYPHLCLSSISIISTNE